MHCIGWNDRFVALPSRTALNGNGQYIYTVTIRNPANGRMVKSVPVWDVGPWNLNDNYWPKSTTAIAGSWTIS